MSTAIILTLVASLCTGCSKKEPAHAPQAAEAAITYGQKAAPLQGLTYVKGDPVTLTEGSIYVVEFWATWCPPCRTSVPHLTEVQKNYKDKGVTVIGISNENIDTVKAFVDKMGDKMNYTVALDTEGKAGEGYMAAYNQNGIPTAFIVDAAGKIAWIGHPMNNLEQALEKAIAARGEAATVAASQ